MTTRNKRGQIGGKWIRPERRLAIYLRDSWTCVYCLKDLRYVAPQTRSLDHVIPITKGGTNKNDNLVTCCKHCNDSKGNLDLAVFAKRIKPDYPNAISLRIMAFVVNTVPITLAKQILSGQLDYYSEVIK